jgi:hypothetical protein
MRAMVENVIGRGRLAESMLLWSAAPLLHAAAAASVAARIDARFADAIARDLAIADARGRPAHGAFADAPGRNTAPRALDSRQ